MKLYATGIRTPKTRRTFILRRALFLINLTIPFLFALLSATSAVAQTTPNTETLGRGATYTEASVWTSVQNHAQGGSQVYAARANYGVSSKLEIGVAASGSAPNDPNFPLEIQPSVKYKFYANESRGVAAATSLTMFVPFANRHNTDTFGMIQNSISKDITAESFPARVTAGIYTLVGRNHDFSGARHGAMLQVEHSLARQTDFSLQWYTGDNRFGYLTPGINFSLPHGGNLYAAYSFGNTGRNNHGAYISYGTSF